MSVHSDSERKYQFGSDPWGTGDATGEYYDAFLQFICTVKSKAAIAVDVGCGEGAFTARVATLTEKTYGIDISPTAIRRAKERFPGIEFSVCDLRHIANLEIEEYSIDLIVVSQVLYYLTWTEASEALAQLGTLLTPDGVICAAANCSGGEYFQPHEFHALFADHFDIVGEEKFQHHIFIAGKRRPAEVLITVDYEVDDFGDREVIGTPEMWSRQVIEPCRQLMALCEEFGAKLTIMLEICELWFVDQYMPAVADRVRAQLVDAVQRGHDVQVHMHTRWLPELGARLDQSTGIVQFNMDAPRLQDLADGELERILRRAKQELEELLQPVRADYEAIVFRAGKYQIQPHERVFAVLAASGYKADSSVWQGGFLSIYDRKPGYDFRSLWTQVTPYWPNKEDINVPVRDVCTVPKILEMPIFAQVGEQWAFDSLTAQRLIGLFQQSRGAGPKIMVGHTKALTPRSLSQLRMVFQWLSGSQSVVFERMQDAARRWWQYSHINESQTAQQEYVRRSSSSPEELWRSLPDAYRRKVEICAMHVRELARRKGRVKILDVGCGTGELFLVPLWYRVQDVEAVEILGIDVDSASIARAHDNVATHSLRRISFKAQPVEILNEAFDLVISTEVIEHLEDPATFLTALRAVVAEDGMLALSTPNGMGYSEQERKLLYATFDLVGRLPIPVKKTFLLLYRKLQSWRWRRKIQASLKSGKDRRRAFATLNFANDVHIQYFTLRRLRCMLKKSGFAVAEVHNVQLLGGLIGKILESPFNVERVLKVLPNCLASSWLVVCHTQADAGQSSYSTTCRRIGVNPCVTQRDR